MKKILNLNWADGISFVLKALVMFGLAVSLLLLNSYLGSESGLLYPYQTKYEYQGVYLANGQVYFGKVKGFIGQSLILEDIYYFEKSSEELTANATLVKFGNEIHQPVDSLRLNRSLVTYIVDLSQDSQVLKAIKDSQKR